MMGRTKEGYKQSREVAGTVAPHKKQAELAEQVRSVREELNRGKS